MNLKKYEVDIQKYKIIKNINYGACGDVYLVQEIKTKEYYAAKVLKDDTESQRSSEMIREVMVMSTCEHQTIIKLYGYSMKDFEGRNRLTIIMELAKNGSLQDLIFNAMRAQADLYYDNTKKQIIWIGISYSMKILHRLRIIHRDIKPGNILLNENYQPKLADFGFSKYCNYGQSTKQSVICGTSFYMADEILNGNLKYDFKVDVFAFGYLMIEIICNTLHESETKECREELYAKFIKEEKNDHIKNLIKRCISKNPKERPTFDEIYEKISNVDGNYCLENIDKNEVLDYIESINEINPVTDILLLKLANEELFYHDNLKNREISKLKKNIEDLQEAKKELFTENKILDERVTRLEQLFKNLHAGTGRYNNQDFQNFETLLNNSPTIKNLKEKTENLWNRMNQLEMKNQPNITFSNHDETKNKYQIFNENNVNVNNTNNNDYIMSLIKALQDNVNLLNNDNNIFKQQINNLNNEIKQIKASFKNGHKDTTKKLLEDEIKALNKKINDQKNDFEQKIKSVNLIKANKPITPDKSQNIANKNEIDNEQINIMLSKINNLEKKVDLNNEKIIKNNENQQHSEQKLELKFLQQNNKYNVENIFIENSKDDNAQNNNFMSLLEKMQQDMIALSKNNKLIEQQMIEQNQKFQDETNNLKQQMILQESQFKNQIDQLTKLNDELKNKINSEQNIINNNNPTQNIDNNNSTQIITNNNNSTQNINNNNSAQSIVFNTNSKQNTTHSFQSLNNKPRQIQQQLTKEIEEMNKYEDQQNRYQTTSELVNIYHPRPNSNIPFLINNQSKSIHNKNNIVVFKIPTTEEKKASNK